jgi:hypothetical protein
MVERLGVQGRQWGPPPHACLRNASAEGASLIHVDASASTFGSCMLVGLGWLGNLLYSVARGVKDDARGGPAARQPGWGKSRGKK